MVVSEVTVFEYVTETGTLEVFATPDVMVSVVSIVPIPKALAKSPVTYAPLTLFNEIFPELISPAIPKGSRALKMSLIEDSELKVKTVFEPSVRFTFKL